MQPLRKDHADHYKDFVREEFSTAQSQIQQEICEKAQAKADEVGTTQFAKQLKLDKLIVEMGKREKALRDFQSKKQSLENDLSFKAQRIADQISDLFNSNKKNA
tara:strand:- start:264 stop:575 length:312 start_codon:yes stop_codon:yes gene_type:complete